MFYEYELSAILEVEKINQIFDAEIRSTFPTLQGFFWTCRACAQPNKQYLLTFSINCSQDEIDKDLFVAVNILHGGKSYHRDFIAIAQITTEVSIHINRVINSVYEQFDLKVTIRCPELISPFKQFFNKSISGELTDFTFKFGEEMLHSHRGILSARSEIFHRMFSNQNFEEAQKSLMIVDDATKDVFKLFLQYLYTNQIPSQHSLSILDTAEVFKVAHKYDVKDLIKTCDDRMIQILKADDPVHDIYQLTQLFNCSQELKKKSFEFVKSKYFHCEIVNENLINCPEYINKLVKIKNSFAEELKRANDIED